jgi:hypothetical protein
MAAVTTGAAQATRRLARHSAGLEGRKREGVRKGELGIAQDFEGQTQAFGHFWLIIGGSCAQAE